MIYLNQKPSDKIVPPHCGSCTLFDSERGISWGEGQFNSPDVFIIGEALGGMEHYQKRPFIGPSGNVLRASIEEFKKVKGEFSWYMTNTVLCRPPGNRNPSSHEIVCCYDRLISEIKESNPKTILLLGSVACETLLNEKVTATRGKHREIIGIPTITTFHPAYILRNQNMFATFAQDIEQLLNIVFNGNKKDWKAPREYTVLTDPEEIGFFLSDLEINKNHSSLDIETFKLDPFNGWPLWIGFHDLLLGHVTIIAADQLKQIYQQEHRNINSVPFIVYDSRMEYKWLKHHFGIELTNFDDPLIMAHLIDERTGIVKKNLKELGQSYLGIHDWSEPVKLFLKDQMQNCPKELLFQYLSYDVEVTSDVFVELDKQLREDKPRTIQRIVDKINDLNTAEGRKSDLREDLEIIKSRPGIDDVYYNIAKPALPFLRRMTAHGIRIDVDYLEDLRKVWSDDEAVQGITWQRRGKLKQIVGKAEFNPGSPLQVSNYLFNERNFKNINQGSTNEETIKSLLIDHPEDEFLKGLLDFREAQKITSTYIVGLYEKTSADGRIHSDFKFEGTDTGRLSSDIQQIPRPTEIINIRKAFLPDEGMELFDADYDQLEFKTGGHMANDRKVIEFVNAGRDIHKEMAAFILSKPLDQVTKIERQFAKNGVFAVMYDTSIEGFLYNFQKDFPFLTPKLADKTIRFLREMFPELYLNSLKLKRFAKEHNFSQTIFGRKKRYPFINNDNLRDVMKKACNSPIQGSASDICLLAGIRIEKEIPEVKIHMLVHDSIVFSAPKGFDPKPVRDIMQNPPFEHDIQFSVSIKSGSRWGESE